MVVVGSG